MQNQQTTSYPIQGLLIFALLCYVLVSFAWGGEKALAATSGSLTVDRDTVYGALQYGFNDKGVWQPRFRIRVRNGSDQTVVMDSLLLRSDSSLYGEPLDLAFSVRSNSSEKNDVILGSEHSNSLGVYQAIAVPAHDSVEIGTFARSAGGFGSVRK